MRFWRLVPASAGNFDSSGYCSHVRRRRHEIASAAASIAKAAASAVAVREDKSVVIRLERIRIWERNKANENASNDLVAGADDTGDRSQGPGGAQT
jgi:hypothetical protein